MAKSKNIKGSVRKSKSKDTEALIKALGHRSTHLPGNNKKKDYTQFAWQNNNPLFSICAHNKHHPIGFGERIVFLAASFFMNASLYNFVFGATGNGSISVLVSALIYQVLDFFLYYVATFACMLPGHNMRSKKDYRWAAKYVAMSVSTLLALISTLLVLSKAATMEKYADVSIYKAVFSISAGWIVTMIVSCLIVMPLLQSAFFLYKYNDDFDRFGTAEEKLAKEAEAAEKGRSLRKPKKGKSSKKTEPKTKSSRKESSKMDADDTDEDDSDDEKDEEKGENNDNSEDGSDDDSDKDDNDSDSDKDDSDKDDSDKDDDDDDDSDKDDDDDDDDDSDDDDSDKEESEDDDNDSE
jgi:hypothetical protein